MRENDRMQFSGELIPKNFDAHTVTISELSDRPDKLVRTQLIRPEETRDGMSKKFAEKKRLLHELSEKFGVDVVGMDSAVGNNAEGQSAIFTIVDKIDGENLKKISELPMEAKDQLDTHYASLARYYLDAAKNKGMFCGDLNNSQFVYGNKYGAKEKKIYLVDVGSNFYRHGENRLFELDCELYNICRDLLITESKFPQPTRLENARQTLLSAIDEIYQVEGELEQLPQARKMLETNLISNIPPAIYNQYNQ